MGWILSLFASWVACQVPLLGADEFRVREAATVRLDNPLAALFLPRADEDPEVNYRLRTLHARNSRWRSPLYVERLVRKASPSEWVNLYLVAGRSRTCRDHDTFEALHTDWQAARVLLDRWPAPPGENSAFLSGSIFRGEYERYLDYLDYHQRIAPAPRDIDSYPDP